MKAANKLLIPVLLALITTAISVAGKFVADGLAREQADRERLALSLAERGEQWCLLARQRLVVLESEVLRRGGSTLITLDDGQEVLVEEASCKAADAYLSAAIDFLHTGSLGHSALPQFDELFEFLHHLENYP